MALTKLTPSDSGVILAKSTTSVGDVGYYTPSELATFINGKTQTGAINNASMTTDSSGMTTLKGGLKGVAGANIEGFGRVYNAVWNDYADFIKINNFTGVPGRCYYVDSKGKIQQTQKRCQKGTLGIHSDTFGYCPGGLRPDLPLDSQGLILGVAGLVLAYTKKVYKPGTPLCSGKGGQLVKMKLRDRLFHPERMVGIFLREETSRLVMGKIEVKGRHWIKIK